MRKSGKTVELMGTATKTVLNFIKDTGNTDTTIKNEGNCFSI